MCCCRPQPSGAPPPSGAVWDVHERAGREEPGQSHGPGQGHWMHTQGRQQIHTHTHHTHAHTHMNSPGQDHWTQIVNGIKIEIEITHNYNIPLPFAVSRRPPCPRSAYPAEVVACCRMWTQTRRAFAPWAQRPGMAGPRPADTPCHLSYLKLKGKRTEGFGGRERRWWLV